MSRQLALTTALTICQKNKLTETDVDYLIDQNMKKIVPEVSELDRVRASCEIVGLCMLKEVMK